MIILHPDHLISATVVADSFTCTRRAALQDRVKATGAAEKPQVYGHILHEVFGEGLRINDWSTQSLRQIIEKILPNYIESLYEIQVQIPEAVEYLMGKMPGLQGWASVFVSANPKPEAQIRDRNGGLATMAINKLLEVEEHIWSPMYGLKGNIDATVQVSMQSPGDHLHKTLTVPLEFKTGKKDNNESHRAQTALYTLLFTDRYDIEVTSGVLYYLETAKTFRVERVRNEIRHMIIQRNELACYVHDKLDLPPMIKKEFMCKNCYAKTSCFTYHKLVEDGDGETSGMGELFEQEVKHLTPLHQEFFRKWDDLLTKEERDSMKFRRELWTMLSSEREALGRCVGNVVVEPGSARENPQGSKINRYEYALVKHQSSPGFSFTDSQLTIGEPVVISDEKGHFALANGFVTKVRPTRITVAVDRRLHNIRRKAQNFDPKTNQSFTGVMEVTSNGTQFDPEPSNPDDPLLLRLDKDEFSNGMATARNNIIRLMERDLFRARELRQMIIEGVAPSFKPTSPAYTLSGPASQQDVNVDQRLAIEKVMSAKDYSLVLGMPGTGKTTTIAHIIRALVSQNKSVLLTSYTHTAVDNILLKIKDDNIPVLRLGAVGKVHPEVQAFADLGGIPKKTIAELEMSYINSKVVATTCLGINQPIFNARVFDYCIVDEASQITLPVCLGPIRMAKTFILVGDHFQLPPLVANKEAQKGGLDVSLFKLLSDAQPSSVVNLEHQYRMAEDIMLLSNTLIYSGRLKCGNASIAKRMLRIPGLRDGLAAHHHSIESLPQGIPPTSICIPNTSCWLSNALRPESRCLFLNTDIMGPPARETTSKGSRITNALECTLTAHLVTTLIRSGVPPNTIGVITFYRSQLALLRAEVKAVAGTTASNELEMHTADKYQGRDKEVIILSCVRNNTDGIIGELLKDWRRVNVAITRAKSKLMIVGSKSTFVKSGDKVLECLIKIMDDRGWVQDLPANAAESHKFEGGLTQTQTQGIGLKDSASQASQGQKRQREGSNDKENQGVFRRPAKVVKGTVDLKRLLDKRPVLKDIVNGI
jgi:DNA replication ATP-dependent helicase Dna2